MYSPRKSRLPDIFRIPLILGSSFRIYTAERREEKIVTDRWMGKDHTLLRLGLGKRGFRLRFNLFDSKTMSRDADMDFRRKSTGR